MRTPRPRRGPPRRLRLPRRTARLRLTVLYGGAAFLACGAAVLAFTYLLYGAVHLPGTASRIHSAQAPSPSPSEAYKVITIAPPPSRQRRRSTWRVWGRSPWTGSSC